MNEKPTEENGTNGRQSFFMTECGEEDDEKNENLVKEQNHEGLIVKPRPNTIQTNPRRKLKWILVSIFLIIVFVTAAVNIGIIWPRLVGDENETENELIEESNDNVSLTTPHSGMLIQCQGDKIQDTYNLTSCICPGDTEENIENNDKCSCPYGTVADPDDSTICIDLPEECLDYFELSDRKRSHTWNTQYRQGWCDSQKNPKRKSIEWKGNNWYRIVGEAGTQIAENHVGMEHCGTFYSGWLNGTHPENRLELVRKSHVCFSHPTNNCYMKTRIRIRNCVNYYVYFLVNIRRGCNKGNA